MKEGEDRGPKATVVVPMYNTSATVGATLRSLSRQTWMPDEIIVVDDGSTDNSVEVAREAIESYGLGERARVVRKANGGPASARNRGIEEASADSERVMFVDSDDEVSPLYAEHLLAGATSEGVLPCSRLRHCAAPPEAHGAPLRDVKTESYPKPLANAAFLTRLREGVIGSACTKAYSLRIIRERGLRFEAEFPEDTRFNIAYLKHCDSVAVIDAADYFYISREGSVTARPDLSLAENYERIGEELCALTGEAHRGDVLAFLYPQFRAVAAALACAGHGGELRALQAMPLAHEAFSAYRPATLPDRLAHTLLHQGFGRLYKTLFGRRRM
ncbi:MAG: glycosyltransferase family 2 protein [Duncaniella sp.]|nr:glycosyltransferase family 2 protein [Duncaniella sp.]